jgi:hypothetical protein
MRGRRCTYNELPFGKPPKSAGPAVREWRSSNSSTDNAAMRLNLALSVSAQVHHCHARNRGYCGHGLEAARARFGGPPLTRRRRRRHRQGCNATRPPHLLRTNNVYASLQLRLRALVGNRNLTLTSVGDSTTARYGGPCTPKIYCASPAKQRTQCPPAWRRQPTHRFQTANQ